MIMTPSPTLNIVSCYVMTVSRAEAGTSGEGSKKDSPVKTPPASSPAQETRTIERSIEARPVDDTMASMVRILYFAGIDRF